MTSTLSAKSKQDEETKKSVPAKSSDSFTKWQKSHRKFRKTSKLQEFAIYLLICLVIILGCGAIVYGIQEFQFWWRVQGREVSIPTQSAEWFIDRLNATVYKKYFLLQSGVQLAHCKTFSELSSFWSQNVAKAKKFSFPEKERLALIKSQKNTIENCFMGNFDFYGLQFLYRRSQKSGLAGTHKYPLLLDKICQKANWLVFYVLWKQLPTLNEKKKFLHEIFHSLMKIKESIENLFVFGPQSGSGSNRTQILALYNRAKMIYNFLFYLLDNCDPLLCALLCVWNQNLVCKTTSNRIPFLQIQRSQMDHEFSFVLQEAKLELCQYSQVKELCFVLRFLWKNSNWLPPASLRRIVVQYLVADSFCQAVIEKMERQKEKEEKEENEENKERNRDDNREKEEEKDFKQTEREIENLQKDQETDEGFFLGSRFQLTSSLFLVKNGKITTQNKIQAIF